VSAVPKVSHATPAQAAAARRNLVKARAALKARHRRSPAQIAASRRNLAIARSAQRARAAGKKWVSPKQVKDGLPGAAGLHALPACGPVAAAEHLAAVTGAVVPEHAVLALHEAVRGATIGGLLEYLAAEGFPGTGEKLAYFEQCDPDCGSPGLIYGVRLGRGYHAVMSYPYGEMASWGMLLARAGTPEEAWWLEWEGELAVEHDREPGGRIPPELRVPRWLGFCWTAWDWVTWPLTAYRLKQAGFRRTGWRTWEAGPDADESGHRWLTLPPSATPSRHRSPRSPGCAATGRPGTR
jgi:hypothetical protein